MDFGLTPSQMAVAQTARQFAREVLLPRAAERDRTGAFPIEEAQHLAALGLMGVNVPADLGGSEAGVIAYTEAMREIAAADASVAVTMAVTNMVAELISAFGTPQQRSTFVPRLTSGEAIAGSFGLSESQAGSDAAGMRTFAERKGDRYVLNGAKQWITSGKYSGVLVIWARTERTVGSKGLSAFIVEGGTKGLTAERAEEKMGLHGSNTAALVLEDVEVPVEQRLGDEGHGFALAMTALDGGRIGIASQALGVARAALEASIRYAKERQAFGKPIGGHQAIQWMLADMKTQWEAARLLTLRAAHFKEQHRPYTRVAAMAKLTATETAIRICDRAIQIHGAYGYIDEFPVERYYRDVRPSTLYEGTSEVQRLVIARDLLKS